MPLEVPGAPKTAEVTPVEKLPEFKQVPNIPHFVDIGKSYGEIMETLQKAKNGVSSEMIKNIEYLISKPQSYLDFGEEGIYFFDGNIFRHTTWKKIESEGISANDLEKSGFTRIRTRDMPNPQQGASLYHNVIFGETLGYR